MSGRGYVPEAEYVAIKASWRQPGAGLYALKNPEKWRNRDMVKACLVNVEEAAKREARLRHLASTLLHGDPRLVGDAETPSLREQIRTAILDQRHWRGELAHWRGRCVAEGDDALPPGRFVVDAEVRAPRPDPLRDPRLAGDPIVQAELAARQQRQQELAGLAKVAAREVGEDDVEGELPF